MPVPFAVMIGGAVGALARYGLDHLIERGVFSVFPWSTFAINVSGCFAAGVVVAALVDRHHLSPAWRFGIVVGFLGAYTTFSTFAQETVDLGETHNLVSRSSTRPQALPPDWCRLLPAQSSARPL